jgi:hypothetical protein
VGDSAWNLSRRRSNRREWSTQRRRLQAVVNGAQVNGTDALTSGDVAIIPG